MMVMMMRVVFVCVLFGLEVIQLWDSGGGKRIASNFVKHM